MFAGGIAHDFNNLLAVTFGCCEGQLFQKNLPPEARVYTEEILRDCKNGGRSNPPIAFLCSSATAERSSDTDEPISD